MENNEPAVELRRVSKTFGAGPGAVCALADVSLTFAAGGFTAIMGTSGSGKSTLLHCAAGLETVDSGQVVVAGHDLRTLRDRQLTRLRRERMGFVFQSLNLLPALSAAANVALPRELAGDRPSAQEVADALASVGLADRAALRPAALSGGQRQRVAIARALLVRPAVLFADEPTGALDRTTGREILALLRRVVDERRQTVVMVTHDPAAAAYADRVVFIDDGRVADDLTLPASGVPSRRDADQAATAEAITSRMTRIEAATC